MAVQLMSGQGQQHASPLLCTSPEVRREWVELTGDSKGTSHSHLSDGGETSTLVKAQGQ